MGPLALFEAARAALAQARQVDEVLAVRDQAEQMKLYARQAKDRGLMADATEIHLRAERKLGVMLALAKASGQLAEGRPPKSSENCQEPGQFSRVTLAEAGIDRNLSARAQRFGNISEQAFEAMVERTRHRIASGVAAVIDPMRDLTLEEKQNRREAKERMLGICQQALPDRKYGVIVADPEWRFEPRSRLTGMDRAAENHYTTSTTAVIASRDVAGIAAKDCVLFLWATAPMLPDALEVMKAWGFAYKTHAIWRKNKIITGYWFQFVHELLLVGTRGEVPAPAPGTQPLSVIEADRPGPHSAKPEAFLELIEKYYPTMPKIELNRRGPARPGWDAWGNEAVAHDPETGEVIEEFAQIVAPPGLQNQPMSMLPGHLVEIDPIDLPAFLPLRPQIIEDAA